MERQFSRTNEMKSRRKPTRPCRAPEDSPEIVREECPQAVRRRGYIRQISGRPNALVSERRYVRKIDSVYRNRDAGMARRGLEKLDKWWDEDDGTLQEVMAQSPTCSYRKRPAA
jgi:hypothetical protein